MKVQRITGPNGCSSNVPLSLAMAVQHGILYAYEWLINLLRDSGTGWKHDASLVKSGDT